MLTAYDFAIAPLCFVLLRIILSAITKKYKDPAVRKLYIKAFNFKMFAAIAFTMVAALYYGEGDTEMYLFATRDMKKALDANDISLMQLAQTTEVEQGTPLAFHFQEDNEKYPVYGFMRSSSNFLVPKLAVIPSYLFFGSFLSLCMIFSFFALGGMIRLYKLFTWYFPKMRAEIALAALFIPSACYWSSGLLKDSITFGSMGYLLYALHNIFRLKRNILTSLLWVVISTYFLFTIKVYILLALLPGIGFWLFGQLSSGTKSMALRRTITFVSLIIAGIAAYSMVNYLTSDEALAKFSLDNILETSESSRESYERRGAGVEGAYFQITATNPVSLAFNGLVATFFRPFPWEISSAIVLLSAAESLIFLMLLVFLFMKKGLTAPFRKIFDNPILILCFTFSIVFAVSIGVTATNFGSLSRYKIPCLPFYLIFVLTSYHLLGQAYPNWFKKILSLVKVSNTK